MAISRKPKLTSPAAGEVDIQALINKGGSTPKQDAHSTASPVIIRLPADLLAKVDAAVAARPIRTPRHTWMLEAIFEKLQRS